MRRTFRPRLPKRPAGFKRKPTTLGKPLSDRRSLRAPRQPAAPGIAELVEHFLSNRAPSTLKAYRADLDAFAAFLGKSSPEQALSDLLLHGSGQANLLAFRWLSEMTEAKLATATRSRRISTLRSLVGLARMIGVVDWELEISGPHVTRTRDVRAPALESLNAALESCGDDLTGTRDKAVLLLALTMGLRRSEISCLRVGDYQRQKRALLIHGKGGRDTWMSVPSLTASALETWLCLSRGAFCSSGDRDSFLNPDCPIFFRLDRGLDTGAQALSPDGVYDIVRRAGESVGVKLWPHALRHAAITHALDVTGGDVRRVQQFSRHSTAAMVMRYDDKSEEDLAGSASLAISDALFDDDEEDDDDER